tara:strand:+ start:1940 stop:2449 length:510 start_codon:yes stop_codon:yes gene_type:complete
MGKPYVMVNTRIKEFRTNPKYKDYGLVTTKTLDEWFKSKNSKGQIIDENRVEFRCEILNASGSIISSGTARELKSSTFINQKSHIENCETSAVGRALGNLGIGIDTSVASAEEVLNAVKNQPQDTREWLDENQFQATLKATKTQAINVLETFRMKNTYKEQIKNKFKIK